MAAAMARADEGYATLERHRRGSPTVARALRAHISRNHGRLTHLSGIYFVARPHARSLALGVAYGGICAICEQALHGQRITERIVDALPAAAVDDGSARACRRDSAYATSYLSGNRAPVSNRAPV